MSYASTVLATAGLVSVWELGDAAGNATDLKSGFAAVYQGAPTRAQPSLLPGGEGKSVKLNGTTQWVSVADQAALRVADTFTFEAWVNPLAIGAGTSIISGQNGAGEMYFSSTDGLGMNKKEIAAIVHATSLLVVGTPYHLTVTKSGATSKVYVNGVDVTGTVVNSTCESKTGAWALGKNGTREEAFLNGYLQFPAFYNVALTPSTIAQHITAAAPSRIVVNEKPPMRQYLLATTPNGRTYRWGEDEPGADQVLQSLDDEDTVPGGYKQATGSLPRKPGVDYGDMVMGTHLEIFGAGRMKVGEYRLERAPRNSGDYLTMDPAAYGYQGHLADDESATGIPIDADMSGWGEPTVRMRVVNAANQMNVNGQVNLLPAGSSSTSTDVAISMAFSKMNTFGTAGADQALSLYDGGGVELGRIMLDFLAVTGGAVGGSWVVDVSAMNDDTLAGNVSVGGFVTSPVVGSSKAIPAGKFFLLLVVYFGAAFTGEGKWEDQFRNIRVFDTSGIPTSGTWPNIGVLASDVIAYAIGRWAPLLKFTTGVFGTIKPSSFVIPHLAFKEAGPISNWVTQSNRFELKEWAVWNDKTFWYNDRGQREGRKRWIARVRPTQLKETGKQMDRVWNGVIVQYQDVDGTTKLVGPTGSGYRMTDSRLLDVDPENPANQIPSERRWKKIAMRGVSTREGAIRTGQKFLELSKALDGSGSAIFNGYMEDDHGALWPYYCAHAGDVVSFVDSSIGGDRYIVACKRNRLQRQAEITLDAPPEAMEALLEQLDIVLVPEGL